MPIYEYHCNTCGQDFECLVIGNMEPECSACKGKKVVRLMSACSFHSKGATGRTLKSSAATSGCSGCKATSCASCGH